MFIMSIISKYVFAVSAIQYEVFQKCFMISDFKSNHILLAERKILVFFVDSTNNISAIVYKVFPKVFQSVSIFFVFF